MRLSGLIAWAEGAYEGGETVAIENARMRRVSSRGETFELGSHEWAALPDLGLPAILAKIDTGARTSALHATDIELYAADGVQRVRFVVHPVPGRPDLARACDAVLAGVRWVRSSVGAREQRCVIVTDLCIGARRWPIEVTLADRGRMRFSMLLGRGAMLPDMVVMPRAGRRQPAIGLEAYDGRAARREAGSQTLARVRTGLRIGFVGVGPVGPTWQTLADAATARGHVVERLDVRSCRLLRTRDGFGIEADGRTIAPLTAVIALGEVAPSPPSAPPPAPLPEIAAVLAVARQAELAGAVALKPAAVLMRMADPVLVMQALWSADVSVAADRLAPAADAGEAAGRAVDVSGLVAGGEILAVRRSRNGREKRRAGSAEQAASDERTLLLTAARILGAGLARVDLVRLDRDRIAVAGVEVWRPLAGLSRPALQACAPAIIATLEARVGDERRS